MPFEPRLFDDAKFDDAEFDDAEFDDSFVDLPTVGATGDERESTLPPELMALGDQLGVDADFLARRFPAGSQRKAEEVAATRETLASNVARRGNVRRGGAAAAIIIAAIGGWRIAALNHQHNVPAVDEGPPIVAVQQVTSPSRQTLADDNPATKELTPRGFGELTGAEQEAVLDLMQDQSSGQAQLSI